MYEDLVRSRRIRQERVSVEETFASFRHAEKDLETATGLLGKDDDWALAIVHNGALQAGRALMYSQGYRPSSVEGHKTVFEFATQTLPTESQELIAYLDRIRRKRNVAIYDVAGCVGRAEAQGAIDASRRLVAIVQAWLPISDC